MIHDFEGHRPVLDPTAFVHPDATVIGQVTLGRSASVWPGAVLRGDMGRIVVGDESSIQDGSICHITEGWSETVVGHRVTVGHRVILHGCRVGDECLIGMGAILLDNAIIGEGSLVGAGALVTVGMEIPPGSLVLGSPAKVIRPVKQKEVDMIRTGWETYSDYAQRFRHELKLR